MGLSVNSGEDPRAPRAIFDAARHPKSFVLDDADHLLTRPADASSPHPSQQPGFVGPTRSPIDTGRPRPPARKVAQLRLPGAQDAYCEVSVSTLLTDGAAETSS
jgi:hypothetical protein